MYRRSGNACGQGSSCPRRSRGSCFRGRVGFDALAVNDTRAGGGLLADTASHLLTQLVVDVLPGAIEAPTPVVVMCRAPRRELVGQMPPRTAGTHEIEDTVDDLTHFDRAWPAAGVGGGDQWGDERPLRIGQVRGVGLPCHTSSIGEIRASHTRS